MLCEPGACADQSLQDLCWWDSLHRKHDRSQGLTRCSERCLHSHGKLGPEMKKVTSTCNSFAKASHTLQSNCETADKYRPRIPSRWRTEIPGRKHSRLPRKDLVGCRFSYCNHATVNVPISRNLCVHAQVSRHHKFLRIELLIRKHVLFNFDTYYLVSPNLAFPSVTYITLIMILLETPLIHLYA